MQPDPKLETAIAEIKKLREALEIIEAWKLPETGKFWNGDPKRPMSYRACFGTNGERDFMRSIAKKALSA